MKTKNLPYVVGSAVLVIAILTMAISANSKTAQAATPAPPLPPKRPASKPKSTVTVPELVIDQGTGNVPLDIVNDVAQANSAEVGKQQGVWLREQGYPMTADALDLWADGEIGIDSVRLIARNEGTA